MIAIAPFTVNQTTVSGWIALVALGAGFGATLEMAGFSYAPNLAAQFYGRDMRVLKTMFSAIVTAMVLIFLSSALGMLDFRMIAVATTYLWPAIIGGLIMGAGFVVGGFCPGTSLTAAATGSRDALVYLFGLMIGILGFSETVTSFAGFWESSDLGRYTISEWLGLPTGVVVVLVVVMAIGVFAVVERIEGNLQSPLPRISRKLAFSLGGTALVLALISGVVQQPSWESHWQQIEAAAQPLLDNNDVQIHPGELLALMHAEEHLLMLDMQTQSNFDSFHIAGSRHEASLEHLFADVAELKDEPAGTIYVAISEDASVATDAWRLLKSEHVPNVYILEGGMGQWLTTFGPAADPDPTQFDLAYEHKITEVTETTAAPVDGGCG